jgi:RNA polymerase sigma-70 factor (ECF subfamily)
VVVVPLIRPEGSGPTDAELVERVIAGDRSAPELLYFRHAGPILDTLIRLLRSEADAEDVLHDAFVIALERLHQLEDRRLFRPWILRTAIRIFYKKERRRRWLSVFVTDRRDALDLVPVATPDVKAELRALLEALDAAPAKDRVAWMLRYVEGYSLPEVAEACDCSLATVKRRIAAAHALVTAKVDVEETPS